MSPPDMPLTYSPFPPPFKLAIAGPMASGKTTLAARLCEMHPGIRFHRTSFAERLKTLARELFNMQNKDRDLLIRLGKHLRDIDANVFAKAVTRRVRDALYNDVAARNWIVDDLRFQNELEMLRRNGWRIVLLRASEETRTRRLRNLYSPEDAEKHLQNIQDASETDLCALPDRMFDCVLYTDTNDTDAVDVNENARLLSSLMELSTLETHMSDACAGRPLFHPPFTFKALFSAFVAPLFMTISTSIAGIALIVTVLAHTQTY